MRHVILLFTLIFSLTVQSVQSQTCTPGAADLFIIGNQTASIFPAPPTSMVITYSITNNSAGTGVSAQGVVVRVANPNLLFTTGLNPGFAGNADWVSSNLGLYTLFTYTGNGGVLGCGTTPTQLQVLVTRNPPAANVEFPLSASVSHAVADSYPYNNVWTNRYRSQ